MADDSAVDARTQDGPAVRRPQTLDAGVFLLLVALPLAVFPPARLPFVEFKLLVLASGTLLVLGSGISADRRLLAPALVWAGVIVLSTIFGVDPGESLVGSFSATGLAMLLCAAALVAVAPNIPAALLERGRHWLVWTGIAVALVMVIARLLPLELVSLGRQLRFAGSTFGNPVFAVGFLAACIPATLAKRESVVRCVLVAAVFGAGFAVAQERSAWLLPVAALIGTAIWVRPGWRRITLTGVTIAVVVAAWIFLPPLASRGGPGQDFTAVGQFQTLRGERQRLALYEANARAVVRRPVLGWGPANTSSAFLASGTPAEVLQAGREWSDAHDLFLQLAVTTGLLGLAAFGWLVIRVVPPTLRPAPGRGWLAAAAATLAIYALFEPLDVALTPLLLLLAGAATGGRRVEATAPRRLPAVRPVAIVVVGGIVAVAALNLGASVLETWGRTRFDANWALRASAGLAPWRLSASDALARNLAFEAGRADLPAGREARALAHAAVEEHPFSPRVRLAAADIELLLGNPPGAEAWVREQHRVFPGDFVTVPAPPGAVS